MSISFKPPTESSTLQLFLCMCMTMGKLSSGTLGAMKADSANGITLLRLQDIDIITPKTLWLVLRTNKSECIDSVPYFHKKIYMKCNDYIRECEKDAGRKKIHIGKVKIA